MTDRELARLQAQSRWLGRAVAALLALLLLAAALSLGAEFWAAAPQGDRTPLHERLAAWLVFWMPEALYLWGLWAVRSALGDIAAGRHLRPALARSLHHVGLALAAGATVSAVIRPNLMRLMTEAGWGRPESHPFSSYLHFDVAYAAVGAVGLALVLLARVLRQAAAVQAELDEII